jgi:hypothetical protein
MHDKSMDPMIEQYKRELLAFSRRYPKYTEPVQDDAPQADVTVQTPSEPGELPAQDVPVSRLTAEDTLYRADFPDAAEAVTVELRLQNVASREQSALQAASQTAVPTAKPAKPAEHDPHEREYASCDSTDPPYCNGTVDTFPTREAFLDANPSYGFLRVQVSVAQQAYPVQNATVEISKTFSQAKDKFVFFAAQTDASGIVPRVTLPAPDRDLSAAPSALQPYATYDVFVSHPNFTDVYIPNCIVFATIETIQQVRMVPKESCRENPDQPFCEEE